MVVLSTFENKPMRFWNITISLLLVGFVAVCEGYEYDANDFATEVITYVEGSDTGGYNNPSTALGRPSVDTICNGAIRPVVTVFPAWTAVEIVTVGTGGHLILKFNHKVSDDFRNPYGYDFIVFGNALQKIGGTTLWSYDDDPCAVVISGGVVGSEKGLVSVSQDGVMWYSFNGGVYADSFAPTLGRQFDTNDPNDSYAGWDNQWWSDVTNPTVPLEPNIGPNDFAGKTVADVAIAYGDSSGGTAFDINDLDANDLAELEIDPNSGCRWIQYIKIESTDPCGVLMPEIDAISDVGGCGDWKHPFLEGDLNKDCRVDYMDLFFLQNCWLTDGNDCSENPCDADVFKNGLIDFRDFAVVVDNWQRCSWDCGD